MSALSQSVGDFIARTRYEDLSPAAVDMTKRCLLDAIGVSLGASGLGEGCRAFIDLALEQGGRAQCAILGEQRQAPPEAAAFANGALAHALDYEDSHDGALIHPNAPVVPAALAIAEAFAPVSGRDLITAVAIGCDVGVRMALSLRVSLAEFGWYPPPILAAFGATAAAARLLHLDTRQTVDALSLLQCQSTCSGEIIHSPHSLVRAVRDAFAARAGVTSALLAHRGVTGFDAPLEGRAGFFACYARNQYDPQALTAELGRRFEIENISFKPWPSCRGTHAAIEAALHGVRLHRIRPQQIDRVVIHGGRMLSMLAEPIDSKRRPSTAIDAKFSLPFTVATALVHGRVGLQSFLPGALTDAEVLRLAARIEVRSDAPHPTAIGAVLELHLHDSTTTRIEVDRPRGGPGNPLSDEDLIEKFIECAGHAARPLDAASARRFVDTLLNLEQLERVDDLMTLLH
ncbi:MmgE/PrpD family protein [Povalibacter sp.]|uniref:MmgE/PrpD family protein n=1 Tax=Povalibacter sp. TaxID=1962978 RepID=UPI002F418DE6